MSDTICALSSGSPPAAIGIIRISGPKSSKALKVLTSRAFEARKASVAHLRDPGGELLDEAVVLWFRGPRTATGEDLVELHCHGGRAVLDAVLNAVIAIPGIRPAEPGEFTRRAFINGRIDLAESEGLADLLSAETELQRAAAIANASGRLSNLVSGWRDNVLSLSAQVEAALDFSDEDDVDELPESFVGGLDALTEELGNWISRPRAEKLGEGIRIVLAGPPNSGKSTLFNALVESEAAITSPIAGTTRDVIEKSVAIAGIPFSFVDTAGLRTDTNDTIEALGIDRALLELEKADVVLWLGAAGEGPDGAWEIAARNDASDYAPKPDPVAIVSAITGEGIETLKRMLIEYARDILPKPGEAALNARQHALLARGHEALSSAKTEVDLLLVAEHLRAARSAFDRILGRATTEDMLDTLFGRFCIGK